MGNHEFDNGVEGLIQPFLQNVNCSVVSANIQPDQTLAAKLSGYCQPYTVINVGSEKVAVVGYTTAETPFLSMPGKGIICCVIDEAFDVFIGTLFHEPPLELFPGFFIPCPLFYYYLMQRFHLLLSLITV